MLREAESFPLRLLGLKLVSICITQISWKHSSQKTVNYRMHNTSFLYEQKEGQLEQSSKFSKQEGGIEN